MKNRFMNFISSANQILLFIAIVVIGSVFIWEVFLYDLFTNPQPSKPDGVEIYQPDETQPDLPKPIFKKDFDQRLKDVFIFMIESDSIRPESKRKTGFKKSEIKFMPPPPRYTYSYRSDKTVNILFVPETNGEGYALFEHDCLITEVEFMRTHEENENRFDLELNLYCVVSKDTNSDGFLGEGDQIDLYASEYNGRNLNLVMRNISEHYLIGDNEVLITQELENDQFFHIYSVKTGEMKKINTEI